MSLRVDNDHLKRFTLVEESRVWSHSSDLIINKVVRDVTVAQPCNIMVVLRGDNLGYILTEVMHDGSEETLRLLYNIHRGEGPLCKEHECKLRRPTTTLKPVLWRMKLYLCLGCKRSWMESSKEEICLQA